MNKLKNFAVFFLLILTCCSDDEPVKKKPVEIVDIIATGNDISTNAELVRLFSETTETSNVAINSTFTISFSKKLKAATIVPVNIRITKNGDIVPIDISVDEEIVTITPKDDLEAETDYVLSLSSAIKAADGGGFVESTRTFSTQDSPLETGLVAHYTFENGLAQDKSGTGNGGVITGALAAKDRDNRDNESLKFSNETDRVYVAAPTFFNNTVGTFAAWVKFNTLEHSQYLASAADEGSTAFYMSFIRIDGTDHSVGTYWRNDGTVSWLKSSTIVTTGEYYHMVLVGDGTEFRIYVNGAEIELTEFQGTNNGKWMGNISNLDNFSLGTLTMQEPYVVPNLTGNLDEVRLYNRVLSQNEITLLYTSTK